MIKWLHHLFNPHCALCESHSKCDSCETLRAELARSNYEKEQMLKYILEPQPILHNESVQEEVEPVRPKVIPWNVRKNMLEEEDRQKASILRKNEDERKQAIFELEKKLNITNETSNAYLNLETGNVQSNSV